MFLNTTYNVSQLKPWEYKLKAHRTTKLEAHIHNAKTKERNEPKAQTDENPNSCTHEHASQTPHLEFRRNTPGPSPHTLSWSELINAESLHRNCFEISSRAFRTTTDALTTTNHLYSTLFRLTFEELHRSRDLIHQNKADNTETINRSKHHTRSKIGTT